ncbi:MAG: hypothetical protein AAF667_02490 [Pseudomonadota bacterium]
MKNEILNSMRVFPTLFLGLICGPLAALAQSSTIEGKWTATSLVSTGVIGDRYLDRVSPFVGTAIDIREDTVYLPNEPACVISDWAWEVWNNDRSTFGSFGGDWSQVGLQSANGSSYVVRVSRLNCPARDWPELILVAQPDHGITLLGSLRVFVVLSKL